MLALSLMFAPWVLSADDPQPLPALEPERIDVVFSRLARQDRALDTLLEIVRKLQTIAEHPDAAAALLSDEGEPTERLRKALAEVAERLSHLDATVAAPPGPAAVAMGGMHPRVDYAQVLPNGEERVLVSVRGTRVAVAPDRATRVGTDTIRLQAVHVRPDDALRIELNVNDGDPLIQRVGR